MKPIFKFLLLLTATIFLFGYFGCNSHQPDIKPKPNDTDSVVVPVDYTIKGKVLSLPANYSLLKEVLKRSGLAATLADTTQNYTFFVQDNTDFAATGIYNINDLLSALHAAIDVQNDSVLLARFIEYHTVSGVIETDSLFKMQELKTLVPDEKIFLSIDYINSPNTLKFNDLNGHLTAPDATLDNENKYSNLQCSNGIIHKINGNLWAKIRKPYRIYWDIAEQPEIIALPNFRQPGCSEAYNVGELSEITWQVKSGCVEPYSQIIYYCDTLPKTIDVFNVKKQFVYADYLRFTLDLGAVQWIEFKTPILIKGKYKIWICYRRGGDNSIKTTFKQNGQDEQIMPYVFTPAEYMPNPYADGASFAMIEQQGWKMYNAKKYNSVVCSHLLGDIEVTSTDRHILRLEPLIGLRSWVECNFDMIQFIPVDEDQLFPRVDILGNWIDANVPECEIFPYEECVQ